MLVNYFIGYILKPQTEEYRALPEAEYLAMQMTRHTGICAVSFALLQTPIQGNSFAYITHRIDRTMQGKNKSMHMLIMEDFCQLEGRLT